MNDERRCVVFVAKTIIFQKTIAGNSSTSCRLEHGGCGSVKVARTYAIEYEKIDCRSMLRHRLLSLMVFAFFLVFFFCFFFVFFGATEPIFGVGASKNIAPNVASTSTEHLFST